MARYTVNDAEIKELLRVNNALWDKLLSGGFPNGVTINLKGGSRITGRCAGQSIGNNAGRGGVWQYYGSVQIDENGTIHDIDFLDIAHIT